MSFKKAETPAEDSSNSYQALMCKARNCPNRWSVDFGSGGLCSRHAWADPSKWGEVTREMANEVPPSPAAQEVRRLTQEEKVATLRRLMDITRNPSRVWAEALREREKSGERLTSFQKACWREALGVRE